MALSPVRLRASMSVGSADTIAFTRSNSPALIASMKASRVASGMPQFYQASAGLRVCTALLFAVSIPVAVRAQTADAPPPIVGGAFTLEALRDLPVGNNPLTAMETVTLETIADRFTAGGLNAATPPRIGGLLNSWTQTTYRVGDVSITDPRTGG